MKSALCALLVLGCGSSNDTAPDATPTTPDAPPTDPMLDARRAAADQTAKTHAACTAIGDFYWEIGNATERLASGAIGTTYTATTRVPIASASKLVFGAYVLERTNGVLTQAQKRALQFTSGNIGLNPIRCTSSPTVASCLGTVANPNSEYDPAELDRFYYNGAHDQVLAADAVVDGGLGLGALSGDALAAEIEATLGVSSEIGFGSPQPAGGGNATAAGYAKLLSAIVRGDLVISAHLGESAVCTLPGASCPTASSSPSPFAWGYSYNHWVEGPEGDGAFSSAGALGFYPWISGDKQLYGVLSRQSQLGGGFDSVLCGQQIRKAWVTATAQ
jgi:hypothetical protein